MTPLFVQALCWARTPQAWSALAQSWTSMKAYRDENANGYKIHKGHPVPASWVLASVPSLGAPFRDNPAEESTLAAWISRAQVSFALAIVPKAAKAAKDSEGACYRESVLECLSGYREFFKQPGYEACRLVLAAAPAGQRGELLTAAFKAAQERLRSPGAPAPMRVQFCAPGEEPLPLELASLASAATLRHLLAPGVGNPIFDAVRSKLVRVPRAITTIEDRRR